MLTEKRIRDAKPQAKRYTLACGKVQGLKVLVLPSGTKTFQLDYRDCNRKQRRLALGQVDITLAEARLRAGAKLAEIRGGNDPLAKLPTVADGRQPVPE